MHALMSAVVGLEIRAAGSHREEPLSPKMHTARKNDSQPTPLHTILGKWQKAILWRYPSLPDSSRVDLHCDYNVFGSAVKKQCRHTRASS